MDAKSNAELASTTNICLPLPDQGQVCFPPEYLNSFSKTNWRVRSVNSEKCTACGKCESLCPYNVFEMKEENGKIIASPKFPERCEGCLECVAACPTGAIELLVNKPLKKN